MNELFGMVVRFLRAFHFWIFVAPWEKAVRVRAGKHVATLSPGFHLKLPVVDRIFLQSDRMRVTSAGKQTLTTRDQKVVTVSASIGYCISDIELLYRTLHHAEDTIINLVKSFLAEQIAATHACNLSLEGIRSAFSEDEFAAYGIASATLYITDLAVARAFRLIGDNSDYSWGQKLNTDQSTSERPA